MILMNTNDVMLEILKDTQWHNVAEIKNYLPAGVMVKYIIFLEYMGLIEINESLSKITSKGLKFLELPV